MATVEELEAKITQFSVRTGAISAERRDIGGRVPELQQELVVDLEITPQYLPHVIRLDVALKVEDTHATYRVLISAQWISEDQTAFDKAVESRDPVLEELVASRLAPQALTAAQVKVMEISRAVDCRLVGFPYEMNRSIRESLSKKTDSSPE